jgi:hypothetical protein
MNRSMSCSGSWTDYPVFYNRQRAHQGYRTQGRTSYQAFVDGVAAGHDRAAGLWFRAKTRLKSGTPVQTQVHFASMVVP